MKKSPRTGGFQKDFMAAIFISWGTQGRYSSTMTTPLMAKCFR